MFDPPVKCSEAHVSEEYIAEESEHAARVRLTNFDVARAPRGSAGRLVILTDWAYIPPPRPATPKDKRMWKELGS